MLTSFTFIDILFLSEKEKDIAEVEAALYYAPRLEGIILSKFCLQNYGVFFKIRSLDVVKLLQTMEKLVVNKRWFSSPEVSTLGSGIANFQETSQHDVHSHFLNKAFFMVLNVLLKYKYDKNLD